MHQILGLRRWKPANSAEIVTDGKFFKNGWGAESLSDLFKNLSAHLQKIPQKEHWNLFYTVAYCGDKKREFLRLKNIVFDIDGIDTARIKEYPPIVLKVLGTPPKATAIVCSGNGLHFIVELKKPIEDKAYIKNNRGHYKAILKKIAEALKAAGLPAKLDPAVWDARRIMRLPGTVNRKPNQPDKKAYLIQPNLQPVDFDIRSLSGLPQVDEGGQVDGAFIKKFPKVDEEAVIQECPFMSNVATLAENRTLANGDKLTEPAWYAWMSIAGKFEKGEEYVHAVSSQYKHYTKEETQSKLRQALEASGPRTCKNIDELWDGCRACPHWGRINSPINLVGKDTIATEFIGFHTWVNNKPVPCYADMQKAFERDMHYKILDGSRIVMVWGGTHYVPMADNRVEEFAQERFEPKAKTNMVKEFRQLIQRTNIKDMEWWEQATQGKMNFQNGVLDLSTMQLLEHSPEFGFRHVLPYNYDPTAQCPVFTQMLERVTCGDRESIHVLLEFMGYALSNDDCWAQKALILVGEGANGKSTFMNVLKELAGAGNYGASTMGDLRRSEYSRQLLDGKLFNISEETPTTALYDSNLFKTMVTGGELQVRSPYKEPYYCKNKAKMIFSCNDLPDAYETTHGFYRRFLLVPFNAKFGPNDPDYDPHIDKKLNDELSGIFNLAIAGYQRLRANQKFSRSKQIEKTTNNYVTETDTVRAWFTENLYINGDDNKFASLKDLYRNYQIEAEGAGERAITRPKFTRKLRALIPDFDERICKRRLGDGAERALERGLRGIEYGSGVGMSEDEAQTVH